MWLRWGCGGSCLGDDVVVRGERGHGIRRAAHVHEHGRHAERRDRGQHVRVVCAAAHVVDAVRATRDELARHHARVGVHLVRVRAKLGVRVRVTVKGKVGVRVKMEVEVEVRVKENPAEGEGGGQSEGGRAGWVAIGDYREWHAQRLTRDKRLHHRCGAAQLLGLGSGSGSG